MSRTYRIEDRSALLTIGIPFFLFGVVFVVGSLLSFFGVPPLNTGEGGGSLALLAIGVVMGGLAAFLGCQYLAFRPWKVTVDPLASLAFHRVAGVTRVRAVDVFRIERRNLRVGVEGDDSRVLTLEHRGGTTTVPFFEAVDEFIAIVQGMNPPVVVTGSWRANTTESPCAAPS